MTEVFGLALAFSLKDQFDAEFQTLSIPLHFTFITSPEKLDIDIIFLEFKNIGVGLFLNGKQVFSGTLMVPDESTGFAARMSTQVNPGTLDISMSLDAGPISGEVLVLENSKILYVNCCGEPHFQISSSEVLLD